MKQLKQNPRHFLKVVLLSTVLILSAQNSSAQNSLDLDFGQDISGSGLGANTSVGLILSGDKNSIGVAANFQTAKFNLSGLQINYRRTLGMSEKGKVELYFLGNITIQTSAHISAKSIRIEQQCRPETAMNYDNASFKVVEGYVGFGIKLIHTKRISTMYSASFGGFGTLNRDYDYKMQREKMAPSLRLRVGFVYNLKKSIK